MSSARDAEELRQQAAATRAASTALRYAYRASLKAFEEATLRNKALVDTAGGILAELRSAAGTYASVLRENHKAPREMLVEITATLEPPSMRLGPDDRKVLRDLVVRSAIDAYYGEPPASAP